jgi:hypothetical protein
MKQITDATAVKVYRALCAGRDILISGVSELDQIAKQCSEAIDEMEDEGIINNPLDPPDKRLS